MAGADVNPEDGSAERRLRVESPRRGRLAAAILNAAAICFARDGYAGTSIGDIVAMAGGSRANIYNIFKDKRGLFEALIAQHVRHVEYRACELKSLLADQGATPGSALNLIGLGELLLEAATAPSTIDLLKLILSDIQKDRPSSAPLSGPTTLTYFGDVLRTAFANWAWNSDGTPAPSEELSEIFVALIVGTRPLGILVGLQDVLEREARRQHVARAVSLFLLIARPASVTEGER